MGAVAVTREGRLLVAYVPNTATRTLRLGRIVDHEMRPLSEDRVIDSSTHALNHVSTTTITPMIHGGAFIARARFDGSNFFTYYTIVNRNGKVITAPTLMETF